MSVSLHRSLLRPYAIGAAITFVALGLVGFLPLFGGPGYEHALATGLLGPSIAAVTTALSLTKDEDRASEDASFASSLRRGIFMGIVVALTSLATALLHALRVGMCELWGALLYFALTAGAGCLLGGAWGAVSGELVLLCRRRRADSDRRARPEPRGRYRVYAVVLALAAPLVSIAVSVYRFVSSPMIFAFDPFVGFFSGTLYDTVIDAGTPLLTYRLGSLATLTSAALLASVLRRRDDGKYVICTLRTPSERARFGLGVLAGLVSLGVTLAGTKLGHFSTSRSIAEDLGAEKHGVRCDVVYPSTVREDQALLLVKDCDEQVVAVERRLGANGPARVKAFFFRDAEDKKRLMGAANTYIAKPWREEVYLQLASYPHPVLGHEIAHVVAGSFGRGPFRIAGSAGGWIPNPGLIEGVAVFASPDDEDLTDDQWAAAMLRIGILPSMQRVFSFGFLGDASAKSYTLAGAFVDWLAANYGVSVVRAWYGGADLEALTQTSWTALDAAFREHLASMKLPPEAESFARSKFERPGIFGRKCPHVVDALRQSADACRDTQRYDEALRTYREVLVKDPTDYASRVSIAAIERRNGDRQAGRAALSALMNDEKVPRVYRDRAEDVLADADFVDGDFDRAAGHFEHLAARTLDEDAARNFEIKALGARDPLARDAVRWLLIGDGVHGPDVFFGGVALGRWESIAIHDATGAAESSPLAHYLVGRNLGNHGLYEEAARELDASLAHENELPSRVFREAIRQRAIVACASSDRESVMRLRSLAFGGTGDDPFRGAHGGRREATLRLMDRCVAP